MWLKVPPSYFPILLRITAKEIGLMMNSTSLSEKVLIICII
ncbi:hypothetical protein RU98_GL000745 [Enterococcus caccae]|nr:hypothetical protein RU98_GL000745 [Enterococcus caccae]